MVEGESPGIVIPAGHFDDRPAVSQAPIIPAESSSSVVQQEKKFPAMKPLQEISIEGLGHYCIGVPNDFEGNSFQLIAVDDDRESIPLMTVTAGRDASGTRIFTPEKNPTAIDFFGNHLNMDELMEQFGPELDSFLKAKTP